METQTINPPPANVAYVVTASGARQPVFPADVPQYDPAWFDERERYLLSKGWEKEQVPTGIATYRDPRASKLRGEVREVGTLPVRGDDLHKTEPIRQMHIPPAAYSFTIEEALDIQRRRDAFGDTGPSPLDRLGTCEDRCNRLDRELEQVKARIRALLTTHQITFEGLKLGLRQLLEV